MDAALVIIFCLFLVETNESGVLFRHALPAPLSITRRSTSRCVSSGMLVRLSALLLSPSRTVLFLAYWHLLLRLGTGRVQKQHGLESSAELTHLRGPEASLQDHRSRIAVPMAIAHAAGREGHERILDPRGNASLRAHMFEQQEGSSRLEDAPDLTQTTLGIMYGTEDEGGHHPLELCIGEWEGLDWGTGKCDGNG